MRYPEIYLWIYFLTYFALAFVWRSAAVYRATGIQPIRLPSTDDVHGYVGRMFKAILLGCLAYLTAHAFLPDMHTVLPPLPWMDTSAWRALGWVVLACSTTVLMGAQSQMGLSWRVGLDADTPGPLVTHGLFAHSRNPIFLSMRLSLMGLVCLLPNGLTLLLVACGELLIQIQVRLEEAHLSRIYGQAYADYCTQVPRWWRWQR